MDITISQTEPISSLPKDYSRLLKKAQREKKPIVLLRRNRPVGALVGWEWLEKAINDKRRLEEKEALVKIKKSEEEFKKGKAKVIDSLVELGV